MGNSERDESPNKYLHPDVRNRVESLPKETCEDWGGEWTDAEATVRELPLETEYRNRTAVRSVEDGMAAFAKYTEFFEYVLTEQTRDSDSVVLLPCGSQKPIGSSSIHQKKLAALERVGLASECDIAIMSEPCTIIPHDMRLSMPAVNYDYPPKYTEEDRAPGVFNVFVDRLAEWIDERGYETVYPYLVKRHQNKFDAALGRADSSPEVVEVPGASVSLETGNYSGDLFKSVEDVTMKLLAVRAFRGNGGEELKDQLPTSLRDEYRDRLVESS